MNLKLKSDKHEYPAFGFSMSLILHALLITVAALIMHSTLEETRISSAYVQIRTMESQPDLEAVRSDEKISGDKKEVTEEKVPSEEKTEPIENKSKEDPAGAIFYDLADGPADSTDLVQVYKENTLDVSLKYPAGWTYLDQNVKNKLDGVTFWTTSTGFNPPPYVHIEVKDKDLFDPRRFDHNYKTRNYTAYYNEPEELEGQITQIIYIRTSTDEDFSLKLIMKGEEAFKKFQPVFFGMVKSFKYGNKFF